MSFGVCSCCQVEDVELHKHHIVPKSRGGSDESYNLVSLCLDCHGKAHDISFTSDSGLVKGGVTLAKEASKMSDAWVDNSDVLESLLDEIMQMDNALYDFLVSGMELGLISKEFLFTLLHPEYRTKRYRSITLDLLYEKTVISAYERVNNDNSIRH